MVKAYTICQKRKDKGVIWMLNGKVGVAGCSKDQQMNPLPPWREGALRTCQNGRQGCSSSACLVPIPSAKWQFCKSEEEEVSLRAPEDNERMGRMAQAYILCRKKNNPMDHRLSSIICYAVILMIFISLCIYCTCAHRIILYQCWLQC